LADEKRIKGAEAVTTQEIEVNDLNNAQIYGLLVLGTCA
jgi:hypothetical protein